jgi:DNA-binding GntR family transcriptional regulator
MVARPKRLGEQVAELLREMIVKGELSPGHRLKEEELARVMGASRTPVREALQRLEQESLLIRRKKGGYLVRDLSERDLQDALDLKWILLDNALEKALKRASEQEFFELRALFLVWDSARAESDKKLRDQAEDAFVKGLCRAADSSLLKRMLSELMKTLTQLEAVLPGAKAGSEAELKKGREMYSKLSISVCEKGYLKTRNHLWEKCVTRKQAIG